MFKRPAWSIFLSHPEWQWTQTDQCSPCIPLSLETSAGMRMNLSYKPLDIKPDVLSALLGVTYVCANRHTDGSYTCWHETYTRESLLSHVSQPPLDRWEFDGNVRRGLRLSSSVSHGDGIIPSAARLGPGTSLPAVLTAVSGTFTFSTISGNSHHCLYYHKQAISLFKTALVSY